MSGQREGSLAALRARVVRPAGAALGRATVRVPALGRARGVGPPARKALIGTARRRLQTGRGLAEVERALSEVVTPVPSDASAWSTLTRLRAALGDLPGAEAAGARLAALPDADVPGLLAWHDVRRAGHGDDSTEAAEALDRAVAAVPATVTETRALLHRLKDAGRVDDLAAVQQRARAAGVDVSARWVHDVIAEAGLERASAAGPVALDAEVERLMATGRDGTRVAGRFLVERGELVRAAAVYRDLPPDDVPSGLLLRGVKAGRAAGGVNAPYELAAVLARAHGDHPRVAGLWAAVQDDRRLLAEGFPEEPARPPAYEPVDRRVLYVLHTTLPYGHAGYSVRSHGIATSVRERGWDLEGVSRLDFPLDQPWWSTGAPLPDHDVVDGVTYHRLLSGDPAPRRSPRLAYTRRFGDALEELSRRRRPALLHAASFAANGLAAHVAARRLGVPLVYEVRGLQDLAYVSLHPERRGTERHTLLRQLEVQAASLADRVLVITRAIRDEFLAHGVPGDRMVVVPNGVHAADYAARERDRELAARLGLSGRTVIGYVGNIAYYEGIELLLEAAARLRPRRPELAVLVVGYGDAEQSARETVQRLGLHDVVRMPGRVPPEEAGRYLSLLDVFVAPRRGMPVTELVSPLKLFQPMAMQIPTVVSSCAALTEIVEDGVTGLVHAKDDVDSLVAVLDRLLDEPELGPRLGTAASDWVRRERDWSVITRRVEEVYAEVLERSDRR